MHTALGLGSTGRVFQGQQPRDAALSLPWSLGHGMLPRDSAGLPGEMEMLPGAVVYSLSPGARCQIHALKIEFPRDKQDFLFLLLMGYQHIATQMF